jgi:hypothetical protein
VGGLALVESRLKPGIVIGTQYMTEALVMLMEKYLG